MPSKHPRRRAPKGGRGGATTTSRGEANARAPAPAARDAGANESESESDDISDDDVNFVRKNAAYASFLSSGRFAAEEKAKGRRAKRAEDAEDGDDVEAKHARALAVKRKAEEMEKARKAALPVEDRPLALPVKKLDGTVVREATRAADAPESDEEAGGIGAGDDDERGRWTDVGGGEHAQSLGKKAMAREIRESDLGRETTKSTKNEKWWDQPKEDESKAKRAKTGARLDDSDDDNEEDEEDDPAMRLADKRRAERLALEAEMSADARRESVKTRIASTCQSIITDPEGRWKELKDLASLCEDRDGEISRLAALSMALVFRDICPGYRIRPPTEKELAMKVSKEVMKARAFESGLLTYYKAYVRVLVRCSGAKKSRSQRGKGGPDMASAVKCLCALLIGLPSFNFRTDILSALVPVFGTRDADNAQTVANALGECVANDLRGDLTLEALHMTAQLVKQSKCNIQPCAFAYVLNVRFDEGILVPMVRDQKEVLSRKQTFKKKQEEREKIRKARLEKIKKVQDKERMKSFGHEDSSDDSEDEEAQFARDLDEGQAVMGFKEKKKMQSRLLEATFEMYFRVLKNAASPEPTPGLPMLSAALTGLAKFTQLISIDFLGDLMEVFRKLLAQEDLLSDTLKAQTLLTACEILSGHGEILQVDTGEFYRQLYVMLGKPSSGATGWQEGMSSTDQRAFEHGTLRVRAIQRFIGGFKQVDQARMAAFAKRLASATIGMEAGECLGSLGIVRQILASYPRVRNLLENERIGNGVFQMDLDDPEHAQGLSAVLWDLCLMSRHYHPTCAAAAVEVLNLPLSGAIAPPPGSHAPSELAKAFSTLRGVFNPPIQDPPPIRNKRAPIERREFDNVFTSAFEDSVDKFTSGGTSFDPARTLKRFFTRNRAYQRHQKFRQEFASLDRMVKAMHAHKAERAAAKSSKSKKSKKSRA